jgi:hypothetical protein
VEVLKIAMIHRTATHPESPSHGNNVGSGQQQPGGREQLMNWGTILQLDIYIHEASLKTYHLSAAGSACWSESWHKTTRTSTKQGSKFMVSMFLTYLGLLLFNK